MRYRDRYVLVFDDLKTSTPGEVADSAARLKLRFPEGYAEYVTELGEGTLSGYLRIWLPRRVEEELAEHRRFLSENFFWDEQGPLPPSRAAETVLLGDTLDGDSLVFHPDRPDHLFVLPRHDDKVYRAGTDLDAAIDWFCDSGTLTRPMTLRYFEPNGKRARIDRLIPLPYDVVRDAVLGLRIHDHVAFEERFEDEEKVFDIQVKVGDDYVDVEHEDNAIKLLIKDIGGDVMVSTGSLLNPQATEVSVTHVADPKGGKLDRLLDLLDELEARAGKPKRRKR